MLLSKLFHVFFPKLCFGCDDALLRNQTHLCTQCLHQLPYTKQHLITENDAWGKFHGRLRIEHCSCLLYFTKGGFVQKIFHHLKYKDQPSISYFLGQIYAYQLQNQHWLSSIDFIVPVPLHRKKRKLRGYNQVDGFAKALSEIYKIPIAQNILTQDLLLTSQTKKTLFTRTVQNNQGFNIHFQSQHHSRHFLLLDDILTTGGTLEACGKKILEIPNSKISILCLAQTK